MVIIFFISFLLLSCNAENLKEAEKNDTVKLSRDGASQEKEMTVWVNLNYFECMRTSTPCHCLEANQPVLLSFMEDLPFIRVYENGYGFDELYLSRKDSSEFLAWTHSDALEPLFDFRIDADTLFFSRTGQVTKFYDAGRLGIDLDQNNSENLVGELNFRVFRHHLLALGYSDLNQIIGDTKTTTYLYCNSELGKVDLLSNEGDCNNMRIVEIQNDDMYIYNYLNSCQGKSLRPKIEKKLIKKIALNDR